MMFGLLRPYFENQQIRFPLDKRADVNSVGPDIRCLVGIHTCTCMCVSGVIGVHTGCSCCVL